ncbi:MAG: DNA-binding protein [Synergistaceae bacterium]|nr:DNA-binding protein [Synergistaceae bacterium]
MTTTGKFKYNLTMTEENDSDILKRRIHFNLLYDFYSPLLTARQRKIYETLCFSDLTLSEAAEVLGISRQAVHVLARNIMKKLDNLERDLHFAKTTRNFESRIKELEQENESLREKLLLQKGGN